MRMMLGRSRPELLVDVGQEHSPGHFDFWVVNGAWNGTYTNGYITIWGSPGGNWTSLDKMDILTDNQDRLRSGGSYGDYRDVFANFHNPDYVAPEPVKFVQPASWDDDIPF